MNRQNQGSLSAIGQPSKQKIKLGEGPPKLRHPTLEEILNAHPKLTLVGKHYKGACPGCGGKNSFVVDRHTAAFWCFLCKPTAKTKIGAAAYKAILKNLGLDGLVVEQPEELTARQAPPETRNPPPSSEGARKATVFWNYSKSIIGTPVQLYLQARGITAVTSSLRYRADALHGDLPGKHRCMAAKFVNTITGETTAVLRTFLDVSDSEHRRRYIGSPKDSGVCVNGKTESEVWTVAEGIEDALSIMQAGVEGAVWAAGGTMGMANFKVPGHVRHLIIACDQDEPGEKAGQELADRISGGQTMAQTKKPTENAKDWNEMLVQGQIEAIRNLVKP